MSASASNILKRQGAAARLSSSFLLLSLLLLLAGPRIENPRCRNPSVFLLGVTVRAFAPRSAIYVPSSCKRAAGDGGPAAGPTSRHPPRKRLRMARLGKIAEEYSSWDGNGNNNNNNNGPSPGSSSSSSSIATADATTEREILRLRTDIAKTDARLQNLRRESAKMDAARAAASASAASSTAVSSRDTPSSALGIAFRTVLAPLAALGAGRAYLRQRAEVREEVARAEADLRAQRADLAARREELERVERFTGPSIAAGTVALGAALFGIPAALEAPRGGPTTQSSSLGIKAIDVPRTAQSPTTLAEQYANTVASAEAERLDQDWIATVKKANAERREQDYNVATGKKAEVQSLEQEQILAAKKAEAARIEMERMEQERIAAAKKADAARIEAGRIEQERIAAEKRAEAARIETGRVERERAAALNGLTPNVAQSPASGFDLDAEKEAAKQALAVSNTRSRPGDAKFDLSKSAVPGVAVLSAALGSLAVLANKNSADFFAPAATNATAINATAMSMGTEGIVSSSFVTPAAASSSTASSFGPFGSSTGVPSGSTGLTGISTPPSPNPVVPTPTEAKTKVAPVLADTRPSLINEMDSLIGTRGVSDSMKEDSASKAAKFDKLGGGSAGIQSFIETEEEKSGSDRKGPIILPAAGSSGNAGGGGLGKETTSNASSENVPRSNIKEPEKMTASPFGSSPSAGTANPFAKQTDSPLGSSPSAGTANPFAKKTDSPLGSSPSAGTANPFAKQTDSPLGSSPSAGTANPFAKQTGSPLGSSPSAGTANPFAKQTDSPLGSSPSAGTANPFAKQTDSPLGSSPSAGTANPFAKKTGSPLESASSAGTANPFAKKTGSPTNPFASRDGKDDNTEKSKEQTTPPGAVKSYSRPVERPSPALATNPFDQLDSKNVLSSNGSSVPISPTSGVKKANPFDQFASPPPAPAASFPPTSAKQNKESPVQKKNPFDQFSAPESPAVSSPNAASPVKQTNPFDQFAQSQSPVGATSPPSFSAKSKAKESSGQGKKLSSSPFQNIVKAFSPSEQEVVDEVKRVASQAGKYQAEMKSDEGRSFADNKKEAARIAYAEAERLNAAKREEGKNAGLYSSQIYSSREPPSQRQRVASVEQVQTAPRSKAQSTGTSVLESLQSMRQQSPYPAGTAAGTRLSDFSQMYQKRSVSKPSMPVTPTPAQRERITSVAAPQINGSVRPNEPQREVNNGDDSWERLEIQWKVGERHFASNDRKRLNSPREFALGQNGVFLQLHLDGQRVAVSLSLDNMMFNMRMRNLQIYVICYDGPKQVVAPAVDLNISAGEEVELIAPSNGSRAISTGLSPFVFQREDGEMVEATREMLNVQAIRDVARVYATFDVAPLL